MTKIIPRKKKRKKAKWLSEEALQIAEAGREAKKQGRRGKVTQLNVEFRGIAGRDKNAFFSEQCKEIEESTRRGETREPLKKIGNSSGTFHPKMDTIRDRNIKT